MAVYATEALAPPMRIIPIRFFENKKKKEKFSLLNFLRHFCRRETQKNQSKIDKAYFAKNIFLSFGLNEIFGDLMITVPPGLQECLSDDAVVCELERNDMVKKMFPPSPGIELSILCFVHQDTIARPRQLSSE